MPIPKIKAPKVKSTVKSPERIAYPGIYDNPATIAAEAASRVAPESPNLKRLFGVNREELYEIGKDLRGNLPGTLPGAAENPRGSAAAEKIMTPKNVQRILDVNAEAEKYPSLVQGMDPWYVMTPYYKRMVELLGPEVAAFEYRMQNALSGMASPGSEVNTEIPRGSAAYFLHKQGRFPEFVEHLGLPNARRGALGVAEDIINVPGHMYHKTAQAIPMEKFLRTGELDMSSPKVPMYIEASGVPETGFQTQTPVGDAHWSRAVGLGDTRTSKNYGASVSNPEMTQLAPWWRDKIAAELGIESVPAQARTWGAFSGQTGVTTPIGAPKLELIADQIAATAKRLGVSLETARDMVMMGKARMGKAEGGMVETPAQEAIANTVQNPNAARMLDMDLANLALMQQPQRMKDGGTPVGDQSVFDLQRPPEPVPPTLREVMAEIGRDPKKYSAEFPPRDFDKNSAEAYQLMQIAKATGNSDRYLESLNPYFDSQIKFDIGAGDLAGYVDKDKPNLAVYQKLRDIENTVPHELTHTLQLQRGKGLDYEDDDIIRRGKALPDDMRRKIFSSKNSFENPMEAYANAAAYAHLVNAAGGDFVNTPEGKALLPDRKAQSDYYLKTMPGVDSVFGYRENQGEPPVVKKRIDPRQSYARQAMQRLGFAEGGLAKFPTPEEMLIELMERGYGKR